jgi:hypothetical protein
VDDAVNGGVLVEDLVEGLLVGDVDSIEAGTTATESLDAIERNLGGVVEAIHDDNIVAVLQQGQSGE